jgi:heat-inducible transcriptional repressor
MSDLEEMGYIIQPHASAGRIPSDKGYRLYVDALMIGKDLTPEQIEFLNNVTALNISRIDRLMTETARAVAVMTNYITIASEPSVSKTKIKHLQLVPIDASSVLLVVITNAKAVRNHVLAISDAPDAETLNAVSAAINLRVNSFQPFAIDRAAIDEVASAFGEHGRLVYAVADSIISSAAYEEYREIYTSGVKSILAFPEFSDLDKARAVINTLEERDSLVTLLGGAGGESVQIIIGSENNMENMRGCSVIKADYSFGGAPAGSVGIIGPTRMDYPQAVAILKTIVNNINIFLQTMT